MPASVRLAAVLVLVVITAIPAAAAEASWVHLELAEGRSDYGNGYRPATAMHSGHSVTLSGMIANPGQGTLATLPAGLRPAQRLIFGVNTQGNTARIDVLPSGEIGLESAETGLAWVSLDGISFAVGGSPLLLHSDWPSYEQGYAEAFAVQDDGRVYLGGVLFVREGDLVARLPDGLHPAEVLVFNILVDNRTTRIDVHPDGRVVWASPTANASWLSLSGISFELESANEQPLPLTHGTQNHGPPFAPAKVARQGDRVSLRGLVKAGDLAKAGHPAEIATLPPGLCPESRLVFGLDGDDHAARIDANSDCRILWVSGGGADRSISLDGLSFYLNPSLSGDSKTAQDSRDLLSDLRKLPLFGNVFPTGVSEQDDVLTGNVAVAGEAATLFAWRAKPNQSWVAAALVPKITMGDLLPNLDDANRLAGAKMQDVVIFAVPSDSETYKPKAGELPPKVAAAVQLSDPNLAGLDAELTLKPGVTYWGNLQTTGLLKTAADIMQLRQPLGLSGRVDTEGEVTLEARLKTDPLTAITRRWPIGFVKTADLAQPELFVTAKGKAELTVGYTSTFEIFDQQLDGELSFGTSGEGAQATTAMAIALKKPGPWKDPHLLGPVAVENVTLHDADIRYERAVTDSGSQDTLAVTTSKTRIFDTDYKSAAFAFTVDSASAYPKAVFAYLETQELTVQQLAELAELAAELSPAGEFNPYAKDGVERVLDLKALPIDQIEVKKPKVYLATLGARVPDDLPQRPSILGAGLVARGELSAFRRQLAATDVKFDYAGLRADTKVGEVSFGAVLLEDTRFRIEATSNGGADAAFSGDTTIAHFKIGSTTVSVGKTGFHYDLRSSCVGGFRISAAGSTDGFEFTIPKPSPEACVPDPLRTLKEALAAGRKIAHLGEEVVTGLGDDAWRGLRGLGKGKITPDSIAAAIAHAGDDPEAAIKNLTDAGKDLGSVLGNTLGGEGHTEPFDLYDRFNTPSKCRAGDQWNLEYGTCWAPGAQMIRLAAQQDLCLAQFVNLVRPLARKENPNHLRLEPCIGNWNQQWQNRQAKKPTGVLMGSPFEPDEIQRCWTAESVSTGNYDLVRILECGAYSRHVFRRDLRDRLLDNSGLCLQLSHNKHTTGEQPVLTTCASGTDAQEPAQSWVFENADSFRKQSSTNQAQ